MEMIEKVINLFTRHKFKSGIFFKELGKDCIPLNSYAYMNFAGEIEHSNWGDDINWFFLKEVIDGKLIPYNHSILTRKFKRNNYVVIGSTIDLLADDNSIVWGAGIISGETDKLPAIKEFRAVRGPLTRAKLLKMGYDCPEVYGDPALLLPLYYNPAVRKRYRLGIIPHFSDMTAVRKMFHNRSDVNIIDLRNYSDWKDVLDTILSCETIASSSLHGLIVGYAYNIPNVWVEFKDGEKRDRFKYDDFFSSIGKREDPVIINYENDLSKLCDKLENWDRGYIDIRPLIKAAPFKLKLNY